MIAGFKEHGFMVAAEHMPDTCTKCPFWLTDLEMQYDGMCFLTGEVIPTPEHLLVCCFIVIIYIHSLLPSLHVLLCSCYRYLYISLICYYLLQGREAF